MDWGPRLNKRVGRKYTEHQHSSFWPLIMDAMRLAMLCSCYHMFITVVDGIPTNCEPNCHLHSLSWFFQVTAVKKVTATAQCTSKSGDWQCTKERRPWLWPHPSQQSGCLDCPSVAAGEEQGLELERLHAESSELPCLFWNTGHRTLNHPVAEVIQLSVQIETLATTRT